ncbi:MAG: zinc-binding protein [Chloroflexi bacterium]|nr:zinc-binding protein [Chloroflexota bacterium]
MSYADKTLTCRDCGQTFAWTGGEQEFYASRGLVNEPGRCPDCRSARRSAQASGAYSGAGGWPGGEREMYTATCSTCGKEARVPFQPREDRPVYCSECFAQVRTQRTNTRGLSGSRGEKSHLRNFFAFPPDTICLASSSRTWPLGASA